MLPIGDNIKRHRVMPSNVATSYSQGPLLPWIVCPLAGPCFRVVAAVAVCVGLW